MTGFIPYSYRDGQPEPWEYLEAGALGTVAVGTALMVSPGGLAKATGEIRPSYISMYGGMVEAGQQIPVIRVHEETVFETELTEDLSVMVGCRYGIDESGTGIVGPGGCVEVVNADGAKAGDTVRVRFPTDGGVIPE